MSAGSGEPADFFDMVNTVGNFKITQVVIDK